MPVTTSPASTDETMGGAVPPALVERLVAADERGGPVKSQRRNPRRHCASVKSC